MSTEHQAASQASCLQMQPSMFFGDLKIPCLQLAPAHNALRALDHFGICFCMGCPCHDGIEMSQIIWIRILFTLGNMKDPETHPLSLGGTLIAYSSSLEGHTQFKTVTKSMPWGTMTSQF